MTTRVKLRREVGGVPAGAEGRVVPHDLNDKESNMRVDFGKHGELKWHPPTRMRPTGSAIRAAKRAMYRDCEPC